MGPGPLGGLQLFDLAAIQLALALVLGAWASSRWLAGADSPWSGACARLSARAAGAGAWLGLPALALAVWLQAAVMAEVPLWQAGPTVLTLLRDTHYGHVALVGFAAWCAVAASAWRGRLRGALLAGLLVTAWSRSAVSHAANSGDASLDVVVDVLHLLATSLWVGMVLVAARLPRPTPAMPDRLDVGRWVGALSSSATGALAVVVLSGAFKVFRAVPVWSLLPESDYGRTLFLKLGLVALAVALGGFNRFRVLPRLQASLRRQDAAPPAGEMTSRLLAVLRLEAAVLVLIVVAAALLAGTEPPG